MVHPEAPFALGTNIHVRGIHSVLWAVWAGFFERQSGCVALETYPSPAADIASCVGISRLALEHGVLIEDCVHLDNEFGNLLHIPCLCSPIDLYILEEVTAYMLRIGSNIEFRNDEGLTPLLKAARTSMFNTSPYLHILIHNGANVFAIDDAGHGALHLVILGLNDIYKEEPWADHDKKRNEILTEARGKLVKLMVSGCKAHVDQSGRTLSRYIYEREIWDIWKAVLQEAGVSDLQC